MAEHSIEFSNFKHSLYFVVPITITILLASILSLFVLLTFYQEQDDIPSTAPVGGKGVDAALLNTIIFIALAFIGGLLLLFLLKKGLLNLIEKFFAIIMGYSAFIFTVYFLLPVYWILIGQFYEQVAFIRWLNEIILPNYLAIAVIPSLLSAVFVVMTLGIERFKSRKVHNFLMIYLGSQLGALFGIHMPTWTVLLILLGLSFYDVYAVFWGPLKAIFQPSKDKRQGISLIGTTNQNDQYSVYESSINQMDTIQQNFDENHTIESHHSGREDRIFSVPVYQTSRISIGLGDFVFFSMLVSHALMISYYDDIVSPFLLSFAGIIIGAYITFRLLEKKDILPALPVSIILGLAGFITGYWILRI